MYINDYLNKLEVQGKKHVLLIATPKDKYPNQYDAEYYKLENAILAEPKSYLGIYEENEDEIMQYVAFRIFLKPIICDYYSVSNRTTTKVKRFGRDEIISFIVAKHYYDTVPVGVKTEVEAIEDGKLQAENFLKQYPIEKFEFASVQLRKDRGETNILLKLNFKKESDNYYFDHIYKN